MQIAVYLPLLLPLLAVPAAQWLAPRCHPRAATWGLLATAVVSATGSTASLALLTAAGLTSGGTAVSVAATVALVAAVAAVARTGSRHLRTLRDAYAEARLHPDSDLVVTPDEAPVAYALPGAPGRVVVSTGMLAALNTTE